MADLGQFILMAALGLAVYSVFALVIGVNRRLPELVNSGRSAAWVTIGLTIGAFLLMEYLLVAQDFSVYYVYKQTAIGQPIFYPVTNFEYAAQIAKEWNTEDEFSGYCGFVTAFDIDAAYASKFDVQNVGGFEHNELWIPAEELAEFCLHIVGRIEILASFYGEKYVGERKY